MGNTDPIPQDLEKRVLGGRYSLGDLVYQTSKSFVFKACEVGEQITPAGTNIAVKVLKPGLGLDREEQFKQEVITHRKLGEHPHIATLYTADVDGPYFFAAMEYIPGDDIHTQFSRGRRLSLEETVQIMSTACDAAQFIGDTIGGHHDIKTKNIKHEKDSRGFILDFGGRLRTSDPGYDDVYSLGVVLDELVSHHDNHSSQHDLSYLQKVAANAKTGMYGSPLEVSAAVQKVLKRRIARRAFITAGIGAIVIGTGVGAKAVVEYQQSYVRVIEALERTGELDVRALLEKLVDQKVRRIANRLSGGNNPYTIPEGQNDWITPGGVYWSDGFWPAINWVAYEVTKDTFFVRKALESMKGMTLTKDDNKNLNAIRFFYSHARGYDSTKTLLDAALARSGSQRLRYFASHFLTNDSIR